MALFNWKFGKGDTVEDDEEYTVVDHKPDGFVLVRDKDGKVTTKFGGNLKKKGEKE